ncbi:RagB/SusD family nutrient uptake outer membrane protein [Mucilaginibacter flavus]|uniref:RagB/SusD family nutrient uptake outer membrane protein n=1 Tax=Mucilaginibacter flavus TaxID=931504 RepID=UPI0025B3880A|nr:RagB/SusD family nutrient uptake outer membrane protein [Mucilaginibacter flavus]MDN3583972.1 RagB/SusD family nutrient uptake outer membrane protein [Mucilaginibacter flavus]
MKKILISTCAGTMLLFGVSCKNVLDIKPTSTFSETTVWSDPALVQVFVNQIYKESVFAFKDGGFGWGSQTDELYSNFNWCQENTYVLGQATPDNQSSSFPLNYSSTLNYWTTLYSTIQKANTFFQNIGKVNASGHEQQITNLKGEVYFLRGLCYFELLKRFGGVPLITKVYTANDQSFTETRATWDQTRDFILSDIGQAVSLLPKTYANSNDNGKATVGAALALKSRLLLYAASPYYNTGNDGARWQAAADAAKAVIDLNLYSLYGSSATYNKIFTDYFNSEVIFARVFSATVQEDRYNTLNRDLSPNGYNGYSAYNVLEQMVEDFDMADGSAFQWKDNTSNPYLNRDPRFYADILYNGAPFQGRGAQFYEGGLDSKESSLSPWNASKTGYTIRKMVDESYNFNVQPYSACQWISFRLAEIYLNYAEAENELGNSATALTYLNKIRQRAGMPGITASGTADLRTKIRHERRIELCFEGHRYFDLRRWGIADTGGKDALGIIITPANTSNAAFTYKVNTTQKRVWSDNMYFYPIPRKETQINPNIKQNPGYN